MNTHHQKLPVKSGLNAKTKRQKKTPKFRPKTIEDADLQALLDKDDTQTQDQLAEALNVTRQAISKRLHALTTFY